MKFRIIEKEFGWLTLERKTFLGWKQVVRETYMYRDVTIEKLKVFAKNLIEEFEV